VADKHAAKSDKDKAAAAAPEGTTDAAEEGLVAPPKRRLAGLFPLIKAVAFVSVLVVVEVVAASMFVPSAQDTERLAKQYVAATEGQTAPTGAESAEGGESKAQGDIDEVELGTFNVTHFNPTANATLSIDFELFAAVLASDEKEFQSLLEKNKVRVREQIIMTLHAAEAKDLSDAGLGLLKRQILEKTNRALGQPLIKEVLFSKFNFVER
jgi:flagellar basal body-associated protein FliL